MDSSRIWPFLQEWEEHREVLVHVDNCAVTGNSIKQIEQFKVDMSKKYKLTDMGPVSWLLGIKIHQDFANRTLSLSQHTYIEAIIKRFNFNDLKPLATPIDPAIPLSKTQSPSKLEDIAKMKNVPYREAVVSLMYAAKYHVCNLNGCPVFR